MALVTTIFVGLIVGALARWIMPGEQQMGWIASVVGALVLLFVMQKLRSKTPTQ